MLIVFCLFLCCMYCVVTGASQSHYGGLSISSFQFNALALDRTMVITYTCGCSQSKLTSLMPRGAGFFIQLILVQLFFPRLCRGTMQFLFLVLDLILLTSFQIFQWFPLISLLLFVVSTGSAEGGSSTYRRSVRNWKNLQ